VHENTSEIVVKYNAGNRTTQDTCKYLLNDTPLNNSNKRIVKVKILFAASSVKPNTILHVSNRSYRRRLNSGLSRLEAQCHGLGLGCKGLVHIVT